MSRLITLIAAVGAALAVAVPAGWGAEPDPWSDGMNRVYGLGEYAPDVRAELLRSEGLNELYGLGEFAPDVRAESLRSEGLNKLHGLGEFAITNPIDVGESAIADSGQSSTATTPNVFQWPQVGIFGIGAALILGVALVAGAMRHRRLAH